MSSEELYSLTKEYAALQRLHYRQDLEKKLKSKHELSNTIKDCFKKFDDLTSIPVNICDNVIEKEKADGPYLKMDVKNSESLRCIKENVVGFLINEQNGIKETHISQQLEQCIDQQLTNLQKLQEKIHINNTLLEIIPAILSNNVRDFNDTVDSVFE